MRTIALFCAALLGGFGGSVRAADPRFGDPGALVNSVDTTKAEKDGNSALRFLGFSIDQVDANVVLTRHGKDLLRGSLVDSFFQIQDRDTPTLRAVKTFLEELRGLVVACKGRVVIKLPLRLEKTVVVGQTFDGFTGQATTTTRKEPWLNDVYPVSGSRLNLTVGVASDVTAEEAKSKGESIIYTFQIDIVDARVLEAGKDDRGTEMDRWTSLEGFDLKGTTPWTCQVRLKGQPARIAEVLPKAPTVEALGKLPFRSIDCNGIPRISMLTNILQEIDGLTTVSDKMAYLVARSKRGEVDAMCVLGRIFFAVEQQRSEGIRLLDLAAALGSGEAAWELAERYANGDEVTRDTKKALRFYAIASGEGYRAAAAKRIELMQDRQP